MEKKKDSLWIDSIHSSIQDISNVSQNLYCLSDLFSRVGNEIVANKLREYVSYLDKSCKVINSSIGQMLSDNVNKGNKEITEMFKILLDLDIHKENK